MFTLPTCAVVALVGWYFTNSAVLKDWITWVGMALLLLITYILMEMNNRNQLIRVRSRMVSSVWLVMLATMPAWHGYSTPMLATAAITLAYFLLFRTYQTRGIEPSVFHYALMIGVASLCLPKLSVCLPLFLWHQTVFLRSSTLRTFCAALVGMVFPFLPMAGYAVVTEDTSFFIGWYAELCKWTVVTEQSYLSLSVQQVASWGLFSLLSLLGFLHYLSHSNDDKIQVRMYLYIICVQWFALEAWACLQPQSLDDIMPLLSVTGAPLIAHFFALTRTWLTNALFVLAILAAVALAFINYALPPLPLNV